MNTSTPKRIIENFQLQLELQLSLQAESKRLRTCILSRQLEEISAVTHQINEISGKMEQVELERRQIIANSDFGPESAHSFDLFIQEIPDPDRKQLVDLRQNLKDVAKETYRFNASNRILLEEALSSVKTTVAIVTRSTKVSTGYDFNGKTSIVNRKKLLNRVG